MVAVQKTLVDLINVSQLARETGLDRATVSKRLFRAGLASLNTAGGRQFDRNAALAAVAISHGPPVDHDYRTARTQRLQAQTARILIKLQLERAEVASVAEFREQAFFLVETVQHRFIRYAREARGRLFRAKTSAEITFILTHDFAAIFDDLKRRPPRY